MLTDAKVAALKPPVAGQEEHRDNKVTGLRLRVGAGGAKSWIVRARAGSKVINKKLGSYPAMGLGAARTAAERLLSALARDGSADAVDRTFGAVAEHWIEKVAKPKNDSWRHTQRQLERHVLPAWRDRRIMDIRRADVRELVEGIEGEVLPNRVLTLIKTIFRHAVAREWIDASPAEGIAKPKQEAERDRVLAMPEVARVWRAAVLLGYPFGQFTQVLALTAQRRTEVASMRWADVDVDTKTWTLKGADTKSDRGHLVPLSDPVVEILKMIPRMGPYVFTSDGVTHMSGYGKAKLRLDALLKPDGDLEPWTFHDLRRTAATHMVRLGVSEEVVGRVLNHALKGVTAKVYALHSYAPEKRSALDRWAAEVLRAVSGSEPSKVVAIRG